MAESFVLQRNNNAIEIILTINPRVPKFVSIEDRVTKATFSIPPYAVDE